MEQSRQKENSNANSKNNDKNNFLIKGNELSDIKHVVAVISGKGGVGKSLVTSLLGVMMKRKGYKVGILDADITGPSIPKIFGVNELRPQVFGEGIFPVETGNDLKIMSINFLLDSPDSPVIWRGPLIGNAVKQFWTDVVWNELDYLFIDMPPGTGDVPLTVFQSIPLDGIVIVISPQDLVSLIVKKSFNMARTMNIPILGIVENMSYIVCPKCGERIDVFGESKTEKIAKEMNIPFLGRIPIDKNIAELCDRGEIEKVNENYLEMCIKALESLY
ncbi:Mrp/NBP35 family ATP-binding protein [Thermoanaerobacterium sp. CMT5567-10]|uniref:Mrp/NBP35 family ATP-binding protein n=1 Tax=Thermoanaerobacterium sp. CMT5567-10 TaxID=3061989 RepID=UPI0026DF08E4|nr:Mrp/NBP35 family ATP-binding protein [Thermoanaerobacterium sp. CMT5567-10]WKV09647.1 Mrp/NBP35 family ATP-binding protein [Thermoanaerobacterium sp. CMT5567-10]